MSNKGIFYASTLDAALQQGRWNDQTSVPSVAQGLSWSELFRKFRKHNPNDTLLALTAELELHTQRSLQQAANQENFDTDTAFERDCPFRSFPHFFHQTPDSTIPCSPPLLISHSAKLDLEALAEQLTHSLKGHTPATSASAISASLALGFAFYALADFERARPLLETAHHVPDPPSSHLGDLLVASYVLRGFILENQQEEEEALKLFGQAVALYTKCQHASPELQRWAERASYRRALLAKQLHPSDSLRLHQEYIPSNQYPFKHATILRSHLYTLCDLPGNEAERINIASVQERYEALLRRITTFPKAGEVNVRILDFVDRCFEIWSQNNSESALKLHARHEIDEADTLRIIAITERALSYTFQSHRLLRYLLTLQMALNNKRQVLKSFMLYSKLWEKAKETDLVEVSRKLRRFRDEDQSSAGGVNGENGKNTGNFDGPPPSPPSNQTIKSSAEEADVDELTTFIETCCVATKVFLSEPREENHARKATAQMTRALELVPSDADSSLRAVCRMWCGIAKSCQALDEADPETRPQLLKSSLELLQQAVSEHPTLFEAQYHLALAYAEHGYMHAALETVQRALELNSSSTDCWNLLALITSVQTAGTAKALQIAADALDGHAVCAPSSDDNVSITAPAEASTFAALRAVIQLRITRIALIESIEGPQTALAYFKDLYTSFAHDFAPFLRGSGDSSLVSDGITAAPESHRSHQLHTVIDSLKVPKRKWSLKSRRSRKTSNNSLAPSTTASSENISLMDSSAPATPVRPSSIGNGSAAAAATAIADIRGRASSSGSSGSTASTGALSQYRQRQAKKLAQVLWLQTAATFRRAGDIEQAREAIWEAEKIDAEYPDVWVQLGLLHARQEHADTAIECMEKALAFSPDHVPALVHLARLLMVKPAREQEQWLDIAVGLMEECSELRGWRSAEVWLTLGEAYERQGRTESARAAILKALELEEGKPIRPFELALPRTL